jgi:Putative auto-transporter adhesin, head GIN domain
MRAISTLLTIAVVASTSFAAPCDHVKGEGNVQQKTLVVPAFHGISVEGSMDVVLTQGATQSVVIEAQPNIAALVTTNLRGGVWIIETEKGYSTDKDFVVRITVPVIDVVEINGSGDVTCEGEFNVETMKLDIAGSGNISLMFKAKKTRAEIAGSGDLKLSGSTNELTVSVAGSGDVNARGLRAGRAEVDVMGSGDVTLYASESLDASIAGSGDVQFAGRPSRVKTNVMGSGDVRQLEGGGPR